MLTGQESNVSGWIVTIILAFIIIYLVSTIVGSIYLSSRVDIIFSDFSSNTSHTSIQPKDH